jgi:hypothetical protein
MRFHPSPAAGERMWTVSDFAFPSTGDPERDAKIAADFRRHDALMSEGLCPNGCAPMVSDDAHNSHCPVCGFTHWTNMPHGKGTDEDVDHGQ